MIEQHEGKTGKTTDPAWLALRRRIGVAAFVVGVVLTLGFFAFFPGLPHVIDWGAVFVALGVGGLVRWGCQGWMTKVAEKKGGGGA
ncbi:hypothetical protein [Streptomyces sp. B93]|uniref:hypothetical protein n=1 Tax=Streptomyces sp. B93 TaxID=2824875 RepID=UPI001B38DEE1|nr:hypothetical protein [Streptomyces sp. B93]MBQ1090762.1 hypothetical protein [Streptomyces sp. B93]